jgi:glycine/D-amino acid oxidase-like deaminating enzyme
MSDIRDVIIVGGGIAGLTVADELARRGRDVLLLEYYPNFGGRIATFRDPDVGQYEIGAGRIFHKHKRVYDLIKKYKLHTFPISTDSYFDTAKNDFLELFTPLRRVLETLRPEILATHTIKECLPSHFHPVLEKFPYRAELDLMRADAALESFKPADPMGADGGDAYVGIVEGIDALTTHIVKDAERAGATLKSRHRVNDIQRRRSSRRDELFEITGMHGKKADEKPFTYHAKHVIIATCRCSLGKFSVLRGAPLLKQLATSPLLRIYAKYPPNKSGKIWFEDIPKTVTSNPLRYVIPINPKTGLIMISYTDGDDTKHWKDLDDRALETEIQAQAKALFPEKDISKPTYLQKHYWGGGCTYWLPGKYDIETASKEAMNPSKNVYVVGESISLQQAWIEGALESAETLLSMYF